MNSRVEDGEPLLSYDGANAVDHSTVLSPLNLKNKMGKKAFIIYQDVYECT